jgi:hypothetical protein
MACKNSCKTTSKYTLMMDKGAYFSDSLFGILWEMLKHRFEHLRRDGKWMD